MNKDFRIALILFLLVGVGSWAARHFGFYNTYWFTDVILHAIAGAGFGFVWLGFPHRVERGRLMLILGAASFAVLGSFGWELWEYANSKLLSPDSMRYYSPELGDSLGDIACGLLGGFLSALGKRIR